MNRSRHFLTSLLCLCLLTGVRAQSQQTPKLDAAPIVGIAEPHFLKSINPITDSNLAEFFNQWAAWSQQWGSSHSNPICDSLCLAFWNYDRTWTGHRSYFVLPATIKMESYTVDFDVTSWDNDSITPVSLGLYVPHLPDIEKVYYVTPAIREMLHTYLGERYVEESDEGKKQRIQHEEMVGQYIDKPWGWHRWRFESDPCLDAIKRYSNGTCLDYTNHGMSGDVYFMNDRTGEYIWILTWD